MNIVQNGVHLLNWPELPSKWQYLVDFGLLSITMVSLVWNIRSFRSTITMHNYLDRWALGIIIADSVFLLVDIIIWIFDGAVWLWRRLAETLADWGIEIKTYYDRSVKTLRETSIFDRRRAAMPVYDEEEL